MFGETRNLSRTGMAFIVPSIRINENYLVGDGRVLNVEIDLPGARVRMKCIGQQYERLETRGGCSKYLVGVEIESLAADQRALYEAFLDGPQQKQAAAALALGADKS